MQGYDGTRYVLQDGFECKPCYSARTSRGLFGLLFLMHVLLVGSAVVITLLTDWSAELDKGSEVDVADLLKVGGADGWWAACQHMTAQ